MAKLNKAENSYRKELKAEIIRRNGFVAYTGQVTVAAIPTFGINGKFATALCSESDKFNRKRGEMVAMQRLFTSDGLPFVFPRYENEIILFVEEVCHATIGYFVPDVIISIGGPIEK